jgi:hypothetical protein
MPSGPSHTKDWSACYLTGLKRASQPECTANKGSSVRLLTQSAWPLVPDKSLLVKPMFRLFDGRVTGLTEFSLR